MAGCCPEPQPLGDRRPHEDVYMESQEDANAAYMEKQEVHDDRLSQGPPIRPMVWESAESRAAFEQGWVQRIDAKDPVWLQRGKRDVWIYLILKLAELLRRGKKIGQAAWSFKPRQVKDLHYGYVWGHGAKEQEEELPSSTAGIMVAGSQWWPVIWVDVGGGTLVPVHCPGLAWQNARPAWAHPSRLQEEVDRPQAIIDSLLMIVDVFSFFAGGFSTAERAS